MANTRTYTRSFAGGEISPYLFGRIDDSKFQSGAALVRNFISTPQGPADNRPGFAYVSATKNSGRARLIRFVYNINQTMVIEMGAGYLRFHTMGATLEYSGTQRAFIPPATVTFTAASETVVTWTGHTLVDGDPVEFYTHFPPPGTLPTGVSTDVTYTASVVDANHIKIKDSNGNFVATSDTGSGTLHGRYLYQIGDLASFSGNIYYSTVLGGGLNATPSSPDWYLMPTDLSYEIPTPYTVDDLFDIHYVQSADVMTLVHPSYAPRELRRLGATTWTLTPINFGTTIDLPGNVSATASPGYLAKIASITTANPAVITTVASHTLALGDGIYISGLVVVISGTPTDLSGFYLVNKVPIDGSGNLIPNQLEVMDYDGNVLDSTGWSSVTTYGTIQYGSKIFNITNEYAVSTIGQNGTDESLLSSSASALNNLNVTGSYNEITWDAVSGALRYFIYKKKNGLWGYIGEASGTSFIDNNIAQDMSVTPPNLDTLFAASNDYPAAVSYFEQRRVFAGSNNGPQNVWMSNSGTESTFTYTLPTKDSDRVAFRAASRESNTIRHVVPLTQMILLTSSGEFCVWPVNSDAITPSTISVRQQAAVGASNVQPEIINNSLVYCAARGGHVRELGYSWQSNAFVTGDLSLRAIHLFDNLTIIDQAYMKAPKPIVWFVSSNGELLGLTYVPEEQIGAWHHHDTDGTFESVTCVSEGNEDRLYAVIKRSVNGSDVRYVERMASRIVTTLDDCFFVDAGATFSGVSPVTTISGLNWLEGKTVAILADGKVQNQKVVTGGSITLDYPATKVQVGIPYVSDLQTVPLVMQIDGFGQGRMKNINKCWVRVYQSSGLFVGPSANQLTEAKQRTTEPYGAPPYLVDDEIEVTVMGWWQPDGQVFIRQANPLPLTVVGLTMQVAIGG